MQRAITLEEMTNLLHGIIEAQARAEEQREKDRKERAEADARLAAERAEADARYEEWRKDFNNDMGGLRNSYGDQVEAMFVRLADKFNSELGFCFPRIADRGFTFKDKSGNFIAQADRFYENGDSAMVVEVKAKLKTHHVDEHIKRLKKIGDYLKTEGKEKKVIGAVAGGMVPENVIAYAHKKGLYVLTQNGESISIEKRPEGFEERDWNKKRAKRRNK